MKKIYLPFLLLFLFTAKLFAQCDLGNYMGALPIPVAAYPYTNAQSITVSAVIVNAAPLGNFTYSCGGNSFAGANPAWWLNANPANASITFNFSQPVCNFTVLVNGTNTTEEFYFAANNGTPQLMNFCTNNFVLTGGGSSLLCSGGGSTGTIITCDNPAGATTYVLTHNGLAAGSRVSLLDCYVGCNVVPPNQITCTVADLAYCVGDTTTVDYVAVGTFNPGNIFTAELSDALGNFAAPTIIGSVAAVASGSIPCIIPPGAVTGTGYRIRVVSSNPPVNGSNNGSNITINQFPNVIANASPASVCIGGSLTLTGSGANTYVWNGGITDGVSFIPPATATYTVTGTDNIGCSNTATVTVPVNPLPIVTATAAPANTVCSGTPVTLSGGGAVTYVWTNPVIDNTPFTPLATATYTVTGTDANNCSNTSSIQITVNPLPVISINAFPNDTVCVGDAVTLTATGANSFTWTGGISNGISFVPPASALYTVTGTDVNNCSSSQTQLIYVAPTPVVNLGPDVQVCEGDQVILDATTPNATYLWQNNTNSQTFTATTTGLYWVTVNVNTCTDADTVMVTVNPYPVIDLGPDQTFCEGNTVLLDATCPGCSYSWNNNSTQATVIAGDEGLYKVTVSAAGCAISDSIFLDQLPLPVVDLGADTTICKGDLIKLDAFQFGATYMWQNDSKLSYLNINDVGKYWVEVTLGECTNRDEINVTYSDKCECPMFVPNAFSPNADQLNDEFRLINARDIDLKQFVIYNRWGQEVFSSTNINIGWEGNYKGVACESGTYYYIVSYVCLYSGKEYVLKGDVTLVR